MWRLPGLRLPARVAVTWLNIIGKWPSKRDSPQEGYRHQNDGYLQDAGAPAGMEQDIDGYSPSQSLGTKDVPDRSQWDPPFRSEREVTP